MPNRLANETSPYLLQHKDYPADWYAWSDEAFAASRDEDKPILLSVGGPRLLLVVHETMAHGCLTTRGP